MYYTHQIIISSKEPILNDAHAEKLVIEQASPSRVKDLSPYWFENLSVGKVNKPYYEVSKKERSNYLPFSHPKAVQYLEKAHLEQERFFLNITDMIKGSEVQAASATGRILGIPVADTESEASYRSAENKKMKSLWDDLLASKTLVDVGNSSMRGRGFWLLLHEVKMALDLISGQWRPESMFYAPLFRTSSVENFLMNTDGYSEEAKGNLYLVSVEFTL
jgi:hypothetical protein